MQAVVELGEKFPSTHSVHVVALRAFLVFVTEPGVHSAHGMLEERAYRPGLHASQKLDPVVLCVVIVAEDPEGQRVQFV